MHRGDGAAAGRALQQRRVLAALEGLAAIGGDRQAGEPT
jgi:hypothetical protein